MDEPCLLLFRGKGVISALIRWQTRSKYSHAALLLPNGDIIEAWQGLGAGVRIKRGLDSWDGVEIYAVPSATAAAWNEVIGFARSRVGAGYDYWSVARFISRRHMPPNDKWFCSELVFAAFRFAGIHLLRAESQEVSPGMLSRSPLITRVYV